MKKKEFLDNLFKYYNQQLLIDNVIGVQIEQNILENIFLKTLNKKS